MVRSRELSCESSTSLSPGRMYTAGLAPFYASNFSLWSAAYCSASGPAAGGCFPLDASAAKKPSFCIADILHAGAEAAGGPTDSLPGAPSTGIPAALGAVHHGAPFHATASPLRPTPVVAPDAPSTAFPPRLSPLSAAYHSHHHRPTQHRSPAAAAAGGGGGPAPARLPGGHTHGSAPAPASKDLKFGIDRILSAEFDPKVKEGNTLRGREKGLSAFRSSFRGASLFVLLGFLDNIAISSALKMFQSSQEKSY